jgi:hypothetical protein
MEKQLFINHQVMFKTSRVHTNQIRQIEDLSQGGLLKRRDAWLVFQFHRRKASSFHIA